MPRCISPVCLSEELQARYKPRLPQLAVAKADSIGVYGWIMSHDWSLTDADREAMLRNVGFLRGGPLSLAEFWGLWCGTYLYSNCTLQTGIREYRPHFEGDTPVFIRPCEACGHDTRDCDCAECACGRRRTDGVCDCCERCEVCCECRTCEGCNTRTNGSFCSTCGTCDDCCSCVSCSGCGNTHRSSDDLCGDCNRCSGCCECNSGARCGKIEASGVVHRAKSPKARLQFNCTRMAGAEVEYNACSDFSYISEWAENWGAAVHSDGSCGWEAVTSPAAGDHMLRQARELVQALAGAGAGINGSCGVHVHVDAGDFAWPDMQRLLAVWVKIEPLMFLLGGQNRVKSRWCVPVAGRFASALQAPRAHRKMAVLEAIFKPVGYAGVTLTQKIRNTEKKDQGRYVALNILPWLAGRTQNAANKRRRGGYQRCSDCTVEFRLHRGLHTLDAERLSGWMRLLVRIVDWAGKATSAEVEALPSDAARILMVVAPDCAPWVVRRIQEWRRATSRKNRTIKYTPARGYHVAV